MLHRGLHVSSLKRYCVTVMDNWTSLRLFWTLAGAHKFYCRHESCANVYKWIDGKWQLILKDIAAELGQHEVIGPGLLHRIISEVQRGYDVVDRRRRTHCFEATITLTRHGQI